MATFHHRVRMSSTLLMISCHRSPAMNRGRPRRRAGPGGRGCVGVGGGDLARAYVAVGRACRAVRVAIDALYHDHASASRPSQRSDRLADHRARGGPAARHRRERGAAGVCRHGGRGGRAVRSDLSTECASSMTRSTSACRHRASRRARIGDRYQWRVTGWGMTTTRPVPPQTWHRHPHQCIRSDELTRRLS
jgi:hypothetical protein